MDMMKRSHEVLPLSEKVKVQDDLRNHIYLLLHYIVVIILFVY